MATLLDAGPLKDVLITSFVFLLVFIGAVALLKQFKPLGENDSINYIISFILAFMTILYPQTQVVLSTFIPWGILVFALAFFCFMFFMFLGVKNETLADVARDSSFTFVAITTLVILFLIALTKAFGPFLLVTNQPGFWEATKRSIFNARFLGLLFMLMVAAYAVRYSAPFKKSS